jgi:hypothetical protein
MLPSLPKARFISTDLCSIWFKKQAATAEAKMLRCLTPSALRFRNLTILVDFILIILCSVRLMINIAYSLPLSLILVNLLLLTFAIISVYESSHLKLLPMFCVSAAQSWIWLAVFCLYAFEKRDSQDKERLFDYGVYPLLTDIFLIAFKVTLLHLFRDRLEQKARTDNIKTLSNNNSNSLKF